jgi:large subunit ribosomal protein L15
MAMILLNNLENSGKKRKRVGRGGSRGGTSGKGGKGQKARSGPTLGIAFEGGQTPLARRLPKRGFSNIRFKKVYEIVNLGILSTIFEDGALITQEVLVEKGMVRGKNVLLKVLNSGHLDKRFIIHAHAFSDSAEEAIKRHNGEVHIVQEM